MAANQRKKRFSAVNVFGYSSTETYRAKKKHLSSLQFDLNWKLNPQIFKWDDNEKRTVAKEEQVGLSKRDLIPFEAPVPCDNNSLADVIAVPKDGYELDNLTDVLSYEVWQSILIQKERSYLAHFLPRGVSPDQVVQDLLGGENFHFGNPFLKWSSSLCSGELHPEAVLHDDQTFRANKKAYYSGLQKYHDNMIRNLQKMKDRCASAKDPKAEIEHMMWRSRKQPSKNMMLVANEVGYHNQEHNIAVDEKACSSDSQKLLKTNEPELSRSKDAGKDKDGKPVSSSDVKKVASQPEKREKLRKANANYGDGSKYMSYVKISKSQHELVMSMKQSGNSIQSKALNCVFSNLNDFNVKPYVMFEEEEQKRIKEYWSNLVKKDLPAAFSNWGKFQSERGQIIWSVCLEIEGKLKHLIEEKGTEHSDGDQCCEEESVHSDGTQRTQEDEAPLHGSVSDDDQDSDRSSAEEQASPQMPSLDVNQEHNLMDLNAEDNHISPKSNDACSLKSDCHVTVEAGEESRSISEYPENNISLHVMVNKERNSCPAIPVLGSSCCPSAMEYASSSEMPLKHPQAVEEKTAQLMDPREGNPFKSLLPQQTDHLPFFSSYQNEERHELLHTIVKHDNYQEEPKKRALGVHPTTSLLMEPSQFPGHSQVQLHPSFPFEPRHKSPSNLYLHPNFQENVHPDNSRYSIPRPEQYTSVNIRDWSSSSQFSAPHFRLSNSMELLNPNWFPVENRAQGGWSGSGVFPNLSLGSGTGCDQSLFSVLTQCSSRHPSASAFNPVGSTDKFIPTGNFSEDLGVRIPRNNHLSRPAAPSPLDYLSGHDVATSTLKTGDMGWINLPLQSSALHDSTGKPLPKSWNQ